MRTSLQHSSEHLWHLVYKVGNERVHFEGSAPEIKQSGSQVTADTVNEYNKVGNERVHFLGSTPEIQGTGRAYTLLDQKRSGCGGGLGKYPPGLGQTQYIRQIVWLRTLLFGVVRWGTFYMWYEWAMNEFWTNWNTSSEWVMNVFSMNYELVLNDSGCGFGD